jgi:hypothetical protein
MNVKKALKIKDWVNKNSFFIFPVARKKNMLKENKFQIMMIL